MILILPIRTVSAMNAREHWRPKAKRVKQERETTAWMLRGKVCPSIPCTVTLTRMGPSNGLDDDNLASSNKGIRDEIAKWLGVDDRSPLVMWRNGQERAKDWAVRVEIVA